MMIVRIREVYMDKKIFEWYANEPIKIYFIFSINKIKIIFCEFLSINLLFFTFEPV